MPWLVGWQLEGAATPELAEEIESCSAAQKWLQDELMWLAADLTDDSEAVEALTAAEWLHNHNRCPIRNPPEKEWRVGKFVHFIRYVSGPTG